MARVAFIKLFTGLNLGIAQLSGELRRKGHDSRVIFLKDYRVVSKEEAHLYQQPDPFHGIWVAAKAEQKFCNSFTPISETEYEILFDVLREFDPTLIGFSLPSMPYRQVVEVTRRVRQEFAVPIIWGGSHPTLEPELCLEDADLVCVGEGEELIVALAEALDEGRDYTNIPGLCFKRGGQVVKNPGAPMIDLDSIAIPDFDRSRIFRIEDDQLERNIFPSNFGLQYSIMTQRGCPYSCSFCVESIYQDMFGKKGSVRRRSVDLVLEELTLAKERYGIEAVLFYDDVFTTHRAWLEEFAPRYKREVGLPFWCYTYPRTTNREVVKLLKEAGCASVTMGIQSGAKAVLAEYNRPMPKERTIKAVQEIVDGGIRVFFDLITKAEVETHDSCRETFEFLLDLPGEAQTVGFFPMSLFPNYRYTKAVRERNLSHALSDDDYEYYHRLYLLARTNLPRAMKKALAKVKLFERHPRLLNPFLQESLPFFYLEQGAIAPEKFREALVTAESSGATRVSAMAGNPSPQFTARSA
jgi:radical SAM superfamily enzyme YgiQ (UPF0313 family)